MKERRRYRGDFSSKVMRKAYKEKNPKVERISPEGIP